MKLGYQWVPKIKADDPNLDLVVKTNYRVRIRARGRKPCPVTEKVLRPPKDPLTRSTLRGPAIRFVKKVARNVKRKGFFTHTWITHDPVFTLPINTVLSVHRDGTFRMEHFVLRVPQGRRPKDEWDLVAPPRVRVSLSAVEMLSPPYSLRSGCKALCRFHGLMRARADRIEARVRKRYPRLFQDTSRMSKDARFKLVAKGSLPAYNSANPYDLSDRETFALLIRSLIDAR